MLGDLILSKRDMSNKKQLYWFVGLYVIGVLAFLVLSGLGELVVHLLK